MAEATYETIEPAYNSDLLRSDNVVQMNDVTDVQQNEGGKNIKAGSSFNDIWVDTWIKSSNYSPKKRGFLIDGINGYIEAVDSYFSGTVFGSQFLTGYTGARIEIIGNDQFFYDDSIGGTTPVTGNTASIVFKRTDYLTHPEEFLIQKRKSTITNDGNVFEMFYDEFGAGGAKNYIYFGRKGDESISLSNIKTNVIGIYFRDLIQMGSAELGSHSGWGIQPSPEIQVVGSQWGFGNPGVGGSRITIGAVTENTPKSFFASGAGVAIGMQSSIGFGASIIIDKDGGYFSGTYYDLTVGNVAYGTITGDAGYFNISTVDNRNIKLSTGAGTIFVEGASIASYSSGGTSCGLSSNFWSNVYTNNLTLASAGGAYINWNNGSSRITFNAQTQTNGSIFSTGDLSVAGNIISTGGSTFVINRGRSFKATQLSYKDGAGVTQTRWFLAV